MSSLLTLTEIMNISSGHPDREHFARAICIAQIKKLSKSPTAFHHETEGLSYENCYLNNVPLYTLPSFEIQSEDDLNDA